jgi:mannose-6-phosphate isomerase-like protein (cupin superfamily)
MITIKEVKSKESSIKPPVSERLKFGYVSLKPGEEIGEHVTDNKEEVIFVIKGTATVIVEGEDFKVNENNLIYIPKNKKHNVKNTTSKDLKYVYAVALL